MIICLSSPLSATIVLWYGPAPRLAAAALLNGLALPHRHLLGAAGVRHRRLRRHPLLDLAGHGHEGILDVGRVLGRRLEEGDVGRLGELLGRLGLHLPLGGQVALVTDQQLVDILRRVPLDLVQPGLDMLEGLGVGSVVDDDDAVRAAVVAARDRTETLLARRVPNLQLDRLAIQLDGADFKVDANGADVALGVRVVGEAQQQAGLAHTRVADQHKLEDVVVLLRHGAKW
mmetsp:Transcript_36305/g.85696  ORF Transcript_36305/g.85696 Transcript_36305/m.85696 type:complete len:230 (+) Transcript_36305:105-794(+)